VSVYVIVGAPGSGKGTQARLLSQQLGLPHVASGDLFRDAERQGTPLGRKVSEYIERGALVPDDLATQVVMERLARPDARNGAILDGFPRTRPQAEALEKALAERGSRVTAALYLGVRPEELQRRLSGRYVCRAEGHVYHETDHPPRRPGVCDVDGSELYQRSDDDPATVRARLEQQLPPMYEVVDHYSDQGVLNAVDGEGPPDKVNEALLAVIRATPTDSPAAASAVPSSQVAGDG
jgi:adenylate kinase